LRLSFGDDLQVIQTYSSAIRKRHAVGSTSYKGNQYLAEDLSREPLGSRFKSSARSFLAFCDVFIDNTSLFFIPFYPPVGIEPRTPGLTAPRLYKMLGIFLSTSYIIISDVYLPFGWTI
jgi:hypothetical protein